MFGNRIGFKSELLLAIHDKSPGLVGHGKVVAAEGDGEPGVARTRDGDRGLTSGHFGIQSHLWR